MSSYKKTLLATGDNPKRGEMALRDACRIVERRGCKLVAPIVDDMGHKFAYNFKTKYGWEIYVVARSVEPYGRDMLVSTQEWLVRKAARNNIPLVMYIKDKGLYVYNCRTVLNVVYGENTRLKQRFLNWEYWYGDEWTDDKSLVEVWRKLQPKAEGLPLSLFGR